MALELNRQILLGVSYSLDCRQRNSKLTTAAATGSNYRNGSNPLEYSYVRLWHRCAYFPTSQRGQSQANVAAVSKP